MTVSSGMPTGTINAQESLYAYGSPFIYIQDATPPAWFSPDATTPGFYWNMSGTATYPVYEIGCPTDISFADNVTANDVLCDNLGVVATIQQRNYIEFTFTVQSLFPLATLRILLKGGAVTRTTSPTFTEKFGFGPIDNNQFWHLYTPKVYDDAAGDFVWTYFHKCQFVDAWTISMAWGQPWKVTGLKLRAYADSTKPSAQSFGMFGRFDPSVIV